MILRLVRLMKAETAEIRLLYRFMPIPITEFGDRLAAATAVNSFQLRSNKFICTQKQDNRKQLSCFVTLLIF
ncbi:MAG: hypothetical protein LBK82_17685 [Planctomycetaceae bacterium]|jgi:hypothetical protein|nr:hypothetical protein [Planctomycetaceae bacterium]